jgi:hypothetical protein
MTRQKPIPVSKLKGGSREVVFDLPASINEGIGKLIMTHAILETQVSELLYELAEISYPAGRVSFGYRNAWDRFKTVITLLDMHGIEPQVDIKKLKDQIEDCCQARDIFAHNVWLKRERTGEFLIRVTKGTFETPEGKMNFQFVPHGEAVPDGYFEGTVASIKSAIAVVLDLKNEVKTELQERKRAVSE